MVLLNPNYRKIYRTGLHQLVEIVDDCPDLTIVLRLLKGSFNNDHFVAELAKIAIFTFLARGLYFQLSYVN